MACVGDIHAVALGFSVPVSATHALATAYGLPSVNGYHSAALGFTHVISGTHALPIRILTSNPNPAQGQGFGIYELLISQSALALRTRSWGVKILLHTTGSGQITDMTPDVESWTVNQRLNSPATFSISIADAATDKFGGRLMRYRPYLQPSDEFYNRLDGINVDRFYAIKNYITIEVTLGGETWCSPYLLVTDNVAHIDNSGRQMVTLSGTDYSEVLLGSLDESMTDFTSNQSTTWSAKTILSSIFAKYGIGSNSGNHPQVVINFSDYPVLQFSPKGGSPMDWMKQLLWVRQAEWYWHRDTLIIKDPGYSVNANASWRFTDVWNMTTVSFKKTIKGLFNEFIVRKVEKAGSFLGEKDCTGGQCLGFNDVSFNTPALAIVPRILEGPVLGTLDTYTYRDQNGNPLSTLPTAGIYTGPLPASKVRFIYTPTINWPTTDAPHFKIQFYGKPYLSVLNQGGTFDIHFLQRAIDSTSQNIYGIRRDRAPIENALIPNASVAAQLAQLLLIASEKTTHIANWEGPLQPFVEPGQTISMLVGFAGIDTPGNFYVESIEKSGNRDGMCMMKLECSQPTTVIPSPLPVGQYPLVVG